MDREEYICGHYLILSGGAKRDRTADLLRATQALSQLSYSPDICQCSVGGTIMPRLLISLNL